MAAALQHRTIGIQPRDDPANHGGSFWYLRQPIQIPELDQENGEAACPDSVSDGRWAMAWRRQSRRGQDEIDTGPFKREGNLDAVGG